MTDTTAAALTTVGRPYGRHAAPRGLARTVPATRGPHKHSDPMDVGIVTRLSLVALIAVAVALVALLAVGTASATGLSSHRAPAAVGQQLTGTDAGLITSPAH